MRKTFAICVTAICLTATGCYAEGHSHLLANGETQRFSSMARCESEATSTHSDGGPKYSGYVCRHKLLFITLGQRDYNDGKPIPATQ